MKQFVVDALHPADAKRLREHMDAHYGPCAVDGLYWIPLPEDLLTQTQKAHEECGPFVFALDLEPEKVSCELLVRSLKRMRCQCMEYANDAQAIYIVRFLDHLLIKLGIIA
jgi:hypothetical protein